MAIIELPKAKEEVKISLEQRQLRQKLIIKSNMTQTFVSLRSQMDRIFKLVWANSELTPQEVFDAFGSEAKDLFVIAGIMQEAMNALVEKSVEMKVPPYEINKDGTVSVKEAKE